MSRLYAKQKKNWLLKLVFASRLSYRHSLYTGRKTDMALHLQAVK